MEIQEALNEDI